VRRALARLARTALSWAPVVGLVPRPERRPAGITAMVRVRGEEEWLDPCLASIGDFADEILVLDNGAAPDVRARLERVAAPLAARLRVVDCPGDDLWTLSNRGLAEARFRFVIRWDADFVAYTDGARDIARLRRFLLALDERRYFLVHVPAAEVAGDLCHQAPGHEVRSDGQVHTASARARFVRVERELPVASLPPAARVLQDAPVLPIALEALRVPLDYRIVAWPTVAYLHVNVKSARHMLLRHFWLEWLRHRQGHATLEDYARARVRAGWGVADLEDAARRLVARYCQTLRPFDAGTQGGYPDALRPYLERPRYRIRYEDGRIVGRDEKGETFGMARGL
jgi:hypothetical protein